ncbi:MAG: hypothetical protein HZC54_02750 [Verrucomicrobia bacterium]|nr:hypothetical protein [Verrucomicrobiota bacterium]
MNQDMSRRHFVKGSVLATTGAVLAANSSSVAVGAEAVAKTPDAPRPAAAAGALPKGKICGMEVSRILLGGNLLTHFTHSRELKYVYALTRHYNTDAKILETLAVAEQNGVNTLVIHTVPAALKVLQQHRKERGGKMQWIICTTAPIKPGLKEYRESVQKMVDDGTDAIYVWGVQTDALVKQGKAELIGEAVQVIKQHGVPTGVGAHDLEVIKASEKGKFGADFYIKTFHHHNYRTGPKPDEIKTPNAEIPGYWCSHPQETADFMKTVEKPWIAFKVMAAGAIPPRNAFRYVFENGADFSLAGMFDFEIAEDVKIASEVLASLPKQRARPWRG